MQFDILQNKRIIGAPYCFCLLKRGVKLTPWSSTGTRIWNLGPDFFPPLLSQKTTHAPVNSCNTSHSPLDSYYSSSLIFWSSQNLRSQIPLRGGGSLLCHILQFNISLWRPRRGYETSPVLHVVWIKAFWRNSATCQCEVWGESGFLRTPTLPCKSQGAHRLSRVFCSCANSEKNWKPWDQGVSGVLWYFSPLTWIKFMLWSEQIVHQLGSHKHLCMCHLLNISTAPLNVVT